MLFTGLQSYLHGRSIKVVLSGQSSDTLPINASVPQGSILGPLLFSALIVKSSYSSCMLMTLLYFAPIKYVSESASVKASSNRAFEQMRLWAAKWNFTFAPTKCKVMLLSRERQPTTPDPYLGQSEMTVEQDLDILCITVERKLLWTSHISSISQRVGALRKVASKSDLFG